MKIKDLLAALRDLDPEANILLIIQPGHPLEYEVAGVAVRSDFSKDTNAGAQPGDVLLLQGAGGRYGSREAWSRPRTY
jgi:hypothetical protein